MQGYKAFGVVWVGGHGLLFGFAFSGDPGDYSDASRKSHKSPDLQPT